MPRRTGILIVLISLLAACGPRPLHVGFDKFITDHPRQRGEIETKAGYNIDEESMQMEYEFYSFTAGGGLVRPGSMLRDYLETAATQSFPELKEDPEGTQPLHLNFTIARYEFKDFRAYVDLRVAAKRGDTEIFVKDYSAQGEKQVGKMYWGGAWAQRHAVHASTMVALDEIWERLLEDVRKP